MCFVKLCIYKIVNFLDYINNKSDFVGDSIDYIDVLRVVYIFVFY